MVDARKKEKVWSKILGIKKQSVWIRALEKLGCLVESGKGSHFVARNNQFPKNDYRSLIVTIQNNPRPDVNQSIYKELVRKGYKESEIISALGFKD